MIEFVEGKDKRVFIEKHTLKQMMETLENNNNFINKEEIKETLLNENQENERLIVNIKKEEDFSCEGEEKTEEDQDPEAGPSLEGGGMSPVETATLLLLSRIALFNKVGNYLMRTKIFCPPQKKIYFLFLFLQKKSLKIKASRL